MIVAIHQPNYLPYLGFFNKIANSDLFVILDDAQFSKGDFHNRNRIKTSNGSKWLTIPVKALFKPIKEIEINNDFKFSNTYWSDYHLIQIKYNYNKSTYFNNIYPQLEEILKKKYNYLIDVNLSIIFFLKDYFNLKTKIEISSKLNLKTSSTQRLIDIIKYFNGDTYLSGIGAKKYLDESLFKENNVNLIYQEFGHPVYKQQYSEFIKNLSAIDYCLNNGGKLFDN